MKDRWDKLKVLSAVMASVVIPVVLAYIGNIYSAAIKEREVQGEFVELAIDILRKEPQGESEELRRWATLVIDNYSGVPLSTEARTELIRLGAFPESSPE